MSKNYKIGSKFRVTSNDTNEFKVGEIIELVSVPLEGVFVMTNGLITQVLSALEFEVYCEQEEKKRSIDWHKNGELPPVGEVCDAFVYEEDSWSEVEIIAHKDGIAIGWILIDQLTYQSRNEKSFRPLRTERDKAIDEMMAIASNELGSLEDVCGVLYMAGYRKEVK